MSVDKSDLFDLEALDSLVWIRMKEALRGLNRDCHRSSGPQFLNGSANHLKVLKSPEVMEAYRLLEL